MKERNLDFILSSPPPPTIMAPRRKPIKPANKATPTAEAAVSTEGAPPNRILKEAFANLFREVLSHYESKEYNEGLEKTERILKENPEHGG